MSRSKVVPFPHDQSLHLTVEIKPDQTLITTPLGSLSLKPDAILVTIEGYDKPVCLHDMVLNWQVTDGKK